MTVHKNLLRSSGCAVLAAILFSSCPQPAADTTAEDTAKVAAAKTALAVTYAAGDSASSVTADLTLPAADTANGASITWSSSNTAVVSDSGKVTAPADDTQVTLTATIKVNSITDTAVFTVTVLGTITINLRKAADACLTYTAGDSASSVTGNLTLVSGTASYSGVTVTWTSGDTDHVTASGTVTRDIADVPVTLTASITDGTNTRTKDYALTVKQITTAITSADSSSATYTFSGTTVTYTASSSGSAYTFTADTAKKTLTAARTSYTQNGTSYTKDEYLAYSSSFINLMSSMTDDTEITLDDFTGYAKAYYTATGQSTDGYTDEQIAAKFAKYIGLISSEDYSSLQEKTRAEITSACHTVCSRFLTSLGYSSWDEAAKVAKELVNSMFAEKTYTYSFSTESGAARISIIIPYDTSAAWYKQNGTSFSGSTSGDNYNLSRNASGTSGSLYINSAGGNGTFSADFSTFTKDSTMWTITDNKNGTITIASGSTTVLLTYSKQLLGNF